MQFSIRDIAHLLDGEIEGRDDLIINNLGTIDGAKEGSISFLSNPKYENSVYSTNASVMALEK